MRITVEIEDQRIREDEPRAYEDAVNAFAAEWKRRLMLEAAAQTPAETVGHHSV